MHSGSVLNISLVLLIIHLILMLFKLGAVISHSIGEEMELRGGGPHTAINITKLELTKLVRKPL